MVSKGQKLYKLKKNIRKLSKRYNKADMLF